MNVETSHSIEGPRPKDPRPYGSTWSHRCKAKVRRARIARQNRRGGCWRSRK